MHQHQNNIIDIPQYFILPFDHCYDEVMEELDVFGDMDIDPSLFFDEAINIGYNNHGIRPSDSDFEDMDYIWVSIAYDRYVHYHKHWGEFMPEDYEIFHSIYSKVIEKIYINIYIDLEILILTYSINNAFTLEFSRFLGKDIVLQRAHHQD